MADGTAALEDRAPELAEVLSECGNLALAVQAEREELELRLDLLDAWTEALETGVARLREQAARGRDCDEALRELRAVHACLHRELAGGTGQPHHAA